MLDLEPGTGPAPAQTGRRFRLARRLAQELVASDLGTAVARCLKAGRLLLNIPLHMRVMRALAAPEVRIVKDRDPKVAFKYLTHYLARGLSRSERAEMLIGHYACLARRLNGDFLTRVCEDPLVLWEEKIEDDVFRIRLGFSTVTHAEGDLSLVFEANALSVYQLSFTIGPGSVFGLLAPLVACVARIQGKGKGFQHIRHATKACRDVAPPLLLLAALQGVALALEITDVVGVDAGNQLSLDMGDRSDGAQAPSVYNEFWLAQGASTIVRGMFHLPVPLPEKPLSQVKQGHRRRAAQRQEFRRAVTEQALHRFREGALRGASPIAA
jgi:uncharacterized protein VirK/YbjX